MRLGGQGSTFKLWLKGEIEDGMIHFGDEGLVHITLRRLHAAFDNGSFRGVDKLARHDNRISIILHMSEC